MNNIGPATASTISVPLDWGVGHYEHTAADLLPAARRLVEIAEVGAGERVVDVGCGTGSAALAAAARGATVIGVDPAARLLGLAREQAAVLGLDAEFVAGTAAQLPIEDAGADVVLSSFGVIFAPDPRVAATEFARVLAPGGRILFSAWLPGGAVIEMSQRMASAVRDVLGFGPGPGPFAWHDEAAIAELFAPHELRVTVAREMLTITATSAALYFELGSRSHPLAVSALAAIDQHGDGQALRTELLEILENGNESDTGFRTTSHYLIATVQ
ncbi:MAG TPA: methyltransferase domain-containing protein [Mycobacterium sp.]|nr:methyltransferase domain-containing protein [Mycobacterium sp.]